MLMLQKKPIISTHQLYNECIRVCEQKPETKSKLPGMAVMNRDGKYHTNGAEVIAPVTTASSLPFYRQTQNINLGFLLLKSEVIRRGTDYARNTLASRRGFVAENFVAETYNLDAIIKKINDKALVPESNKSASPDLLYNHGKNEASLKFYKDAVASAKAQTNKDYVNQKRIIPEDQVNDAIEHLDKLARKNEFKGRTDATQVQRKTAENIDSKIISDEGVESTPLTKKQADDLSNAFKVDKDGNIVIDEKKIDKVFEETGVTDKVHKAKLHNDLKGLGISAAIGFGVGIAITAIMELAASGISAANFDEIIFNSFAAGTESAVLSAATYGINKLTTNVLPSLMSNVGYTLNFAVTGLISVVVFSTYQFVKMKINGEETGKALSVVGKQAGFSLSVLAVSVIAQGVCGGAAGIIVSTSIGLIYITYNIAKTAHQRRISEQIREYSIEQYKPLLLRGLM